VYAEGRVPQLDTVQVDSLHGPAFLHTEAQLAKYQAQLDWWEELALSPDESRDFIRDEETVGSNPATPTGETAGEERSSDSEGRPSRRFRGVLGENWEKILVEASLLPPSGLVFLLI
jgi:hypothetical protein